MSTSPEHQLDRRRFLGCSAAGAGLLAFAGGPAALADIARASHAGAPVSPTVLLHDPRFELAPGALGQPGEVELKPIRITGDPVRLWRSEAGLLLRTPGTRVLGVTTWPDLLMFRGLAAETRRHVRHERYDPRTGAFAWLIA